MNEAIIINKLPLTVPDDRIFMRLGRYRHHAEISDVQMKHFTQTIAEGKKLCNLAGAWTAVPIVSNDGTTVMIEGGDVLVSAGLATLLSDSAMVLLFAVTAGAEISQAALTATEAGRGSDALVLDAVGGEAADAACGWLQDYARQQLKRRGLLVSEKRFSPGYGGLSLDTQKIFFHRLNLAKLGMRLLDSGIMLPEKSVTAIAGIV